MKQVQPGAGETAPLSDNLDGNLKDWRSILADIRVRFTELLNSGKE